MAVAVKINDLVKHFGNVKAVDHVTVTIEPAEIFFLLGPRGCGKTTLLRTIAGFHQPDAGSVFIGDRDVTNLPPYKRDTGMVFQSYALWPHMTVAENVAFGLTVRKCPKSETARRVEAALAAVHMSDRAKYKPNQLSGGQQQRVALARALVIEPQCILLDEPLSNLDAKLRIEMRTEIRRICKEAGLTAIYVTHDQKEALSIADRLAVLRGGHIEQVGSPIEVYRHPANEFVAGFIGEANFLKGRVAEVSPRIIQVDTTIGRFEADAGNAARKLKAGDETTLCIRPEGVSVNASDTTAPNVFPCWLVHSAYQGEVAQHQLEAAGRDGEPVRLAAVELGPLAHAVGSADGNVRCQVAPSQVVVL
jgi:iron(III) transport system ATP-binding protein